MFRFLGALALYGFVFCVTTSEGAYAQGINGIQTQGTLSLPEIQLSPFSAIQLPPGQQRLRPLDQPRGVHDVLPYTGGYSPNQLSLQAASGSTIPLWQGSAVYQGQTYSYQMVGQNPTIKLTSPSTVIQTIIVPLVFTFPPGNSVFDPTVRDPTCSPSGSPVAMTWFSPVFQTIQESPGGTNVGTGQYASLFQRANFWNYVQPTGINPNYTVSLNQSVGQIIYVKWPNATLYTARCGRLAAIDRSVWDSVLRSQVFPLLVQHGVGPTTLPIFLTYDVVFCDPPISNTFVLG
jgi:hypothetical protein